MRLLLGALLLAGLVALASAEAGERDFGLRKIARLKSAGFLESPAYNRVDNSIYFSDLIGDTIYRHDIEHKKTTKFKTPSHGANGIQFDTYGNMYICEGAGEHGGRRVIKRTPGGEETVIADKFEGKRLNSPNDLALDEERQVLFFSDPRYGDRTDMELDKECVFRVDLRTNEIACVISKLLRPNGLAISHDGTTLFVNDNDNSVYAEDDEGARLPTEDAVDKMRVDSIPPYEPDPPIVRDGSHERKIDMLITPRHYKERALYSYPLDEKANVDESKRTHVYGWNIGRGGDGICLGKDGYIYVAAGINWPRMGTDTEGILVPGGIHILDVKKGHWDVLRIKEDLVTNCDFGPETEDGKETLWITAGRTLYKAIIDRSKHFEGYMPPEEMYDPETYKDPEPVEPGITVTRLGPDDDEAVHAHDDEL